MCADCSEVSRQVIQHAGIDCSAIVTVEELCAFERQALLI